MTIVRRYIREAGAVNAPILPVCRDQRFVGMTSVEERLFRAAYRVHEGLGLQGARTRMARRPPPAIPTLIPRTSSMLGLNPHHGRKGVYDEKKDAIEPRLTEKRTEDPVVQPSKPAPPGEHLEPECNRFHRYQHRITGKANSRAAAFWLLPRAGVHGCTPR